MLRTLTAGLLMLAASGCDIGIQSAIDAAPFEARMSAAPFADGVYCNLKKGDDGGLLVEGQAGDNPGRCSTFTWEANRRLFVSRNDQGTDTDLKLVDLGDGLFMMQLPASGSRDDKPFAFTLWAGATLRDVVLILPITYTEEVAPIGARHPAVVFSIYKPAREVASAPIPTAGGAEVAQAPENPDVFYISAGSPADIRDLVRDIFDWVLEDGAHPPERAGDWKGEGMLVRDQPSQTDHAPTAAQQRDIDAMVGKILVRFPPAP